jgi:glycosyltransferase involved in cell wall biosynthesis
VIPCYNEAAGIGAVVAGVRAHLPATLVVDDGSSDRTAEVARSAGASVMAHSGNQGKGAALRSGMQAVFRQGFTWALLLDGDGQHDPQDIPHLLRAASFDDVDLVIGNRMENARSLPWVRRGVNRWMSRRISGRAGLPCPDSQCGFRLVRLAAWSKLRLRRDRFETESELLIAFAAAGCRVRFVPVRCLPSRRPSHIRPLRDTWRWFRWWWDDRVKPGGRH